jgi:hypothetical protein
MGRFLLGLLLGITLTWFYFTKPSTSKDRNVTVTETETKQSIKDSLKPDVIRNELKQTGKVIREKTEAVTEKISDATITTLIIGKYAVDPDLSAKRIDVTTENGVVTLNGQAPTADLIGHAIDLAMETKGVHRVISNLQILEPTSDSDITPMRSYPSAPSDMRSLSDTPRQLQD